MGMTQGNVNTFPSVRDVRLLCAELDTEREVIWRPREHELQGQADDWTKVTDNSDWRLHGDLVNLVLAHRELRGKTLGIDIFAANSLVPSAYFARFPGPGCLGVDAFAQQWGGRLGREEVAWINGPFQTDGQLRKG